MPQHSDSTAGSLTTAKRDVRIHVSDLTHHYDGNGGSVTSLAGLDMQIYEGEFFCLVGPSGSGKSTLLRILSGLLEPDHGTVEIADGDSARPTSRMVFQEHDIFPWKTVVENVAFGLKLRDVPKRKRREVARSYLEKVNLSEFGSAYPHELSGGMKQRVSLARAFASDPSILLLDEPFGSVDAQTQAILQEELLSLWNESRQTIIYVTHDIREAIRLGDRIGVMSARPGKIKRTVEIGIDRPRTREAVPVSRIEDVYETIWQSISVEVERSITEPT